MNKKVIIGIVTIIVIAIVGGCWYFLLGGKDTTDAPKETKVPSEEVKVGDEDTKTSYNPLLILVHNITGRLSLFLMLVHLGFNLNWIISKITKNKL